MLAKIAAFELRYHLFSPVFAAVFTIFGLLTFGSVVIDEIQIGSTSAVNINSPHAISQASLIWTLFGMFIPVAFLVSGILRDRDFGTAEMFFTTPIRERDYLMGRFLGGFAAVALAFTCVPLAFFLGSLMPWLDPENVGPNKPEFYLYAYAAFGLVNLAVTGCILFTVANLTRSFVITFAAMVAFLVLYFVGNSFLNEPAWRTAVAIADPFAFNTYGEMIRYWTPAELNSQIVPFEGVMAINRLLWIGVALALFLLNLAIFRFRVGASGGLFKRRKTEAAAAAFVPAKIELPRATPRANAAWRQFRTRVAFESGAVVRNVAFWVLLALGMANAVGSLLSLSDLYGTPLYPVTRVMIDLITGTFTLIPLIVVIYYAGELVWRERAVRFAEVVDATPTPNWVFVWSKFVAMNVVLLGLFGISLLTAVIIQLSKGYTAIEPGQYMIRLIVDFGVPFAMLAALSLFAQVATNNRWLGMLAMLVYLVGSLVMSQIGWEHPLYQFAGAPLAPYSDMNGYGHFLGITLWFHLYWGAISLVLMVFTYALWSRGALQSIWRRAANLGRALTPASAIAGGLALGVAAAAGGWIFYNTNIRNTYVTVKAVERQSADYEKAYRALELAPQPKIMAVYADVDIFPQDRRYAVAGKMTLINDTKSPLPNALVGYDFNASVINHALSGASVASSNQRLNMYEFTFDPPLAPGASTTLTFSVERTNPGFRHRDNVSTVNHNGTFFNSFEAMPSLGYDSNKILSDRQARRRQGLEPIDRMPKLEDERYWAINSISPNVDYIDFETVVSTSEDQIAIAPGDLQREWSEGGRRYFHYKMNRPILNFYSFLSAQYALKEDAWNDIKLQVFYDPKHDYNVDRMFVAMKDSLDHFTKAFSPFQYNQMRILEFPAYASFAQSFPNTVPYSEAIGFIADNRDEEEIDYVYYVTAHEVAHQWWAHQLMSSNNQGGTMLIESFAQYSALMVMEEKYGPDHMRRFLKYELDRYLSSRGSEAIEEQPLYRVENQPYIHYRKGSIVMYALKDRVGKDVVDRAMARLIAEYGYKKSGRYATTLDFLRILREEAGPEADGFITDLFEKIVLLDLSVSDATATQRPDGRWDVTIDVSAKKYEADGDGVQKDVELDEIVDLGVFSEDIDKAEPGSEHVLAFEKKALDQATARFTFTTDVEPKFVGVDPYNKLIDRNSDDNLRRVTIVAGEAS